MKRTNKNDKHYPSLLGEINRPPEPLYYKGILPEHDSLMISIVGTRKATERGERITRNISKKLAKMGITIVSGLALGIDASAHIGALEVEGKTIAVLANGLNRVYPKEHTTLAKEIIENGGCLVSEYPPDASPTKNQFLERNRITSGMSIATIVIEAPSRSGSLSTARHAIEQNREIFVVPGPADHKNYKGSHKLIRQGARLITSADEIISDLNLQPKTSEQTRIKFKTN